MKKRKLKSKKFKKSKPLTEEQMKNAKPVPMPNRVMTYTVYEWHLGSSGCQLTLEQIMSLGYRYVKFDTENSTAWVSNCCNFKTH